VYELNNSYAATHEV